MVCLQIFLPLTEDIIGGYKNRTYPIVKIHFYLREVKSRPSAEQTLSGSTLVYKKEPIIDGFFLLAGAEGVDRLLRILMARRPNALRSVPDFTALRKNLPQATFSISQTLSGSTLVYKKEPIIDGFFLLAGAEGVEPSLMVLETTVKPFNYAPINLGLVGHQGLEPRTDRL